MLFNLWTRRIWLLKNSFTNNMQLLKIHQFALLIIFVMAWSRKGKTISGLTQPNRSIIAALKMSRCPNDQGIKQIHPPNMKRTEPLTIESSAYIRSPDNHIFHSKRSFGCLMQFLRSGNLHQVQCHSLYFNLIFLLKHCF